MAISDDLNSIRTHLEDDYTALETLGVSVEDRNIENIKDMAKQIYAKFPKTSYAEGTEITLSNTLKGKLDFEDDIVGYGQTEQDTTEGYNLLDVYNNMDSGTASGLSYNVNVDGIVSITGTATNYSGKYSKGGFNSTTPILTLKANHTYRILLEVANNTGSVRFYIGPTGQNPYYISNITTNGVFTQDYTISEDVTITQFSFIGGQVNNVQNNCIMKVALIDITNKEYNVWEKYTGNSPSPSPSYPQEIEVVRGKNVFSSEVENGKYSETTGEKLDDNAIYRNATPIQVLPNTTYTFSINGVASNVNRFYYDKNGTFLRKDTSVLPTFTIPNDTYYLNVYRGTSGGNTGWQLEKGSQATSYLPYNTIEVVERGKNLFDLANALNETINAQGVVGPNPNFSTTTYLDTKPNTVYYFSSTQKSGETNKQIYIAWYDINKTFLSRDSYNELSHSFTAPANCYYMRVGVFSAMQENIMLEQNSSATTYEPYITPKTYQLSLGEHEFNGIGNYKDELIYDVDEDKVYKNKAIGKYQFTGNENWAFDSATYNRIYISSIIINPSTLFPSTNDEIPALLCINLKVLSGTSFLGDTTKTGVTLTSNGTFSIRNTVKTSLEQYKTWLSTDKPKLYYALRTAVKEEITGTLKDQIKALYNSHSFTGTTIIEINGNLPLIMKVRALKGN